MGYLTGNGSQSLPYIIYDEQSWELFISYTKYGAAAGFMTQQYFSVVSDINCGGKAYGMGGNSGNFKATLIGNGHRIYNLSFIQSGGNVCKTLGGTITGLFLDDFFIDNASYYFSDTVTCAITHSRFSITKNRLFYNPSHLNYSSDSLFINKSGESLFNVTGTTTAPNSVYVVTDAVISIGGGTVVKLADAMLPSKYPNLSQLFWVLDGISYPYLFINGNPSDTQKYVVKGFTRINGIGKKRGIAILSSAYFGVLKKLISNDDGSYIADLWQVSDPVFVIHYDDYGAPISINTAYALGLYVHPKIPNGYRYKCTTSGTSGSELPAEPWSTTTNLVSGTAIFTPEPVYKAETFLVVPKLYDLLTGQPV